MKLKKLGLVSAVVTALAVAGPVTPRADAGAVSGATLVANGGINCANAITWGAGLPGCTYWVTKGVEWGTADITTSLGTSAGTLSVIPGACLYVIQRFGVVDGGVGCVLGGSNLVEDAALNLVL